MRKLLVVGAVGFSVLCSPARAQFCPGFGYVFEDVPASDAFCGYITWVAQNGISLGCEVLGNGNRLYCPSASVSRNQMAAFLNRLVHQPNSQSLEIGTITKPEGPFLHNYGLGNYNTFAGVNAGNFTTTGWDNTAFGYEAMRFIGSGIKNTAVGTRALRDGANSVWNTAVGAYALTSSSGANNTAVGAIALAANSTGNGNTAVGSDTLSKNFTGNGNVALGTAALEGNTTGNNNVAVGVGSLVFNVSGGGNVAIGNASGVSITSGSNNVHVASAGVGDESATTRIGDVQTRTFVAGIRGVTTSSNDAINVVIDSAGQLGTISSSREAKDDIADMDEASAALSGLRPVVFHYKSDHAPSGRRLQYGLIAEEVAEVYPGLVARNAQGKPETVMYQYLAPMLLNEFQKQQKTIDTQARRIEDQQAEIAELRRAVEAMAAQMAAR